MAGRRLSRREVSALLGACSRDKTVAGIRDVAIVALMVTAGLRRSEVVGLQVSDYATRTGTLSVREAKGGQQQELMLTNATRKKVTVWLRKRGRVEGPLFCPVGSVDAVQVKPLSSQTIYDIVGKRTNQARIDRCSPHDLRRTFVIRLLEQGVDLNTVGQLAGHQSVQTTARYDRRGDKVRARAMRRSS